MYIDRNRTDAPSGRTDRTDSALQGSPSAVATPRTTRARGSPVASSQGNRHGRIGLHARPAAVFVRAVTATGLPVTISKDGRPGVDARSLLEVMTEDFECGCQVELAVAAEALPACLQPRRSRACPGRTPDSGVGSCRLRPRRRPARTRRTCAYAGSPRRTESPTNDGGPHHMVGPAVVLI